MTDCTSPVLRSESVVCVCVTVVRKGEDYSDISVCFFNIIIIPLYMKTRKTNKKRDVLFPVRLHGGTRPVGPAWALFCEEDGTSHGYS